MEAKVAKLEAYMERAFADIADMKAEQHSTNTKLDTLVDKIGGLTEKVAALPTRDNLNNYILVGIGIALAVIAIVIGGIIGGLDWIKAN